MEPLLLVVCTFWIPTFGNLGVHTIVIASFGRQTQLYQQRQEIIGLSGESPRSVDGVQHLDQLVHLPAESLDLLAAVLFEVVHTAQDLQDILNCGILLLFSTGFESLLDRFAHWTA